MIPERRKTNEVGTKMAQLSPRRLFSENSIEHGNHAELRIKRPECGGAEANTIFRVQNQKGGSNTEEKLQKST